MDTDKKARRGKKVKSKVKGESNKIRDTERGG